MISLEIPAEIALEISERILFGILSGIASSTPAGIIKDRFRDSCCDSFEEKEYK